MSENEYRAACALQQLRLARDLLRTVEDTLPPVEGVDARAYVTRALYDVLILEEKLSRTVERAVEWEAPSADALRFRHWLATGQTAPPPEKDPPRS